MEQTIEQTTPIPVTLGNGTVILVESTVTYLEGVDIDSVGVPSLDKVGDAIEGVAQDLLGSIRKVKPDKATVELGFEVSGSAGIPVLAKGTAKANITVTLEWEEESPPAT